MMRKSTLVLIIAISALMFYVGCDDNNGGGGGQAAPTPTPTASPPPGEGVPPPSRPAACDNCPCDFFNVPETSDCWSLGLTPNPTFETQANEQGASCEIGLNNPDAMVFADLITQVSQGAETGGTCQISITNKFVPVPEQCQDAQVAQTNVSAGQIQDCRTCLEGYASALNDSVGLTNEPPYECATPPTLCGDDCPDCANCPCSFSDVPLTAGCWVSPAFDPGEEVPGERCSLFPADLGFGNGLAVFLGIAFACPQGQACCRIMGLNSDSCPVSNETFELSVDNVEQVRACQACLEEYAAKLDNMGMGIPVANPPYECITQQ
jgi:hypothetical protein